MVFSNSSLKGFLLKYFNLKDSTGIFVCKGSRISNGTIIGDGTRINGKILIKGSGNTEIGKYCALGEDIKIISSNHEMNSVNLQYGLHKRIGLKPPRGEKMNVKIGHNVWIGDSAIILSGVTIGNGAVIAAGSVVTKNVEPYSVTGGVPARHIKFRFDADKISEIESSQWWNWPLEKMIENKDFLK